MKKILLTTTALIMIPIISHADTSSMNTDIPGMGILENNWIRAGVNGTTGTFGSGNRTSPGLLFDPTGTGTFDPSYDYLTPGSPFDGVSVKIDGVNYSNNNSGNVAAIANDGNRLTDGENTLSWTGSVEDKFSLTSVFTLAPATPYIDISSSITMLTDATTLSFGKFIDPDSQGMPGDSSSTDNVLGYGVIPDTNVAFSEATVSRYALGIYTTDTNVTAGINGWSTQADGYNGTTYTDADGNPVNYGNSDDTIGISWTWTGISAGDILTANYAYIFGPSAFDAAEDAINGGAGGGADVSSWGTLEDVGSATDAASGGGSTPEPVITTETVVDASRPVLTASITHHESSVADDVQTIDREKTTTTTTPMKTVTYTDGVETSSEVADSVVTTAVTNPGSFVGRVDQVKVASAKTGDLHFKTGVIGIDGDATHFGVERENENGVSIGFGISSGEDVQKVGLSVARNGIKAHAAKVDATYSYDRTIGDFSNSGQTTESGYEVGLLYAPHKEGLSPVVGGVMGRTTIDGWTETGSIQSALTFDSISNDYTTGILGAEYNGEKGSIGAIYYTTKELEVNASLDKVQLGVRRDLDTGENAFSFGFVTKF
jgi:hypothetical protein